MGMQFWAKFKAEHESKIKEFRYTLFLIRNSPLTILGLIIITTLILVAIFAPYIAPYDPERTNILERLQPPSPKHLFGTDDLGRDIFSRVVWGARISLEIGFTVVFLATAIGTVLGLIAGYYRGKIDEILMRITDMFFAIPSLILAMALSAALQTRNIWTVMLAVTFVWWPSYVRIVRATVLSLANSQFVEAAKSVGASSFRIMFRHILPNSLAPLLVQMTLDLGAVILVAAGLSFIGFGAGPNTPEWGRMVAEGRNFMTTAWWMITFPGLAIFITVLGFNLLGDGLRDILDPRLRR